MRGQRAHGTSRLLGAALAGLMITGSVWADARPFGFLSDTYTEGKGNKEYEQWVTWKHSDDSDRVDFRHEVEFGITDYFDLAIYLANWHWKETDEGSETRFDTFAVEGIVYLSNPITDPVGVGIYNEAKFGPDKLELEQKLLLHKDIGAWTLVWNLGFETEIEFEDGANEVEGEILNAFGASYSLSPTLRLGGEVLVESAFEDWRRHDHTTVWAGPAIGYEGGKNWWITISPLAQVTDVDSEPDLQLRLVGAIQF